MNPNLKPWIKGQSGNPSGRPKALLTRTEAERTFQELSKKTSAELLALSESPKATQLELMIISAIQKTIETGDVYRLQYLMDRAVGKLPQAPEIDPETEQLKAMSDDELFGLLEARMLERKKPA